MIEFGQGTPMKEERPEEIITVFCQEFSGFEEEGGATPLSLEGDIDVLGARRGGESKGGRDEQQQDKEREERSHSQNRRQGLAMADELLRKRRHTQSTRRTQQHQKKMQAC